jgi:hypothetical protein
LNNQYPIFRAPAIVALLSFIDLLPARGQTIDSTPRPAATMRQLPGRQSLPGCYGEKEMGIANPRKDEFVWRTMDMSNAGSGTDSSRDRTLIAGTGVFLSTTSHGNSPASFPRFFRQGEHLESPRFACGP